MLEEIVSSLLLVIGLVQLYVVYCIYCENFGSQKRKWKLTILTLMSTAFMICDFAYRRMPNGISMSIYSLFGEGALYCHMLYQLDILETFQKIRESKQSGLISFLRWSLFLWFIFVLFPVVPTHIGFLPLPYTTIVSRVIVVDLWWDCITVADCTRD
ncbi:hypothetical protein EDD86DRAFT_72903 [Gorgonomyces haynaldii]|nr:hypothetical protein EDD86DRAFT_72903 [Gorgonomyces haynaldii]